jgi:hypothetical protein
LDRFNFPFSHGGAYDVHLTVTNKAQAPGGTESCPNFPYTATSSQIIEITDPTPAGGVDGICSNPRDAFIMTTSITNTLSNGVYTANTGQHDFGAQPNSGQGRFCNNCVYTWKIQHSVDASGWGDWEDVPLDPYTSTQQGLGSSLNYDFARPGFYAVTVEANNPPGCPGVDVRVYTPQIMKKEVSILPSPTVTTSMGYAMEEKSSYKKTAPDTILELVTPTVIVTKSTQEILPQVLLTVGTTYPINPSSTLQPGSTIVPQQTLRGSGGPSTTIPATQATITATAPSVNPSSSMSTTTRTPGFALWITLCAGLVVLVLRRK